MILDHQEQLLMVFVLLWMETDTDCEQNLMRGKKLYLATWKLDHRISILQLLNYKSLTPGIATYITDTGRAELKKGQIFILPPTFPPKNLTAILWRQPPNWKTLWPWLLSSHSQHPTLKTVKLVLDVQKLFSLPIKHKSPRMWCWSRHQQPRKIALNSR